MKKLIYALQLILILSTLTACVGDNTTGQSVSPSTAEQSAETISEQQLQTIANDYVQAFLDGDFDKMMNFAMIKQYSDAMSKDKLMNVYQQMSDQAGAAKQIVKTTRLDNEDYYVYSIIVEYEKANLAYTVTLDNQGQLAGFFVKPYPEAIGETEDNTTQSNYIVREVTFGKEPYMISGTLTLPSADGKFPVVVLIHGSGPNDRDETIYENKPFYDIAEGLAAANIASLRYDKRTFSYVQQLAAAQLTDSVTIFDETIDDAVYAINFLKDEPQVEPTKIFVIGHSLGANQAPRIARQSPDVAGLIIMAGNVSFIQDILAQQIPYLSELDGAISDAEQESIDAAKAFQSLLNSGDYSSETPADQTFGLGYNYWKDLYQYNPVTIAQTLDIPMLILQGERDYQVTPDEFKKWREGLGDKAQYRLYEGLNHLFIYGEGKASPEEYKVAGHVDQQVIDDIAAFIKAER